MNENDILYGANNAGQILAQGQIVFQKLAPGPSGRRRTKTQAQAGRNILRYMRINCVL